MDIANRLVRHYKTYSGLYNSLFIFNAFAILFYHIWAAIWKEQLGYTIGETLMNYQFGFYRRALVGNIFILLPTKTAVLTAITIVYSICLITPLLILKKSAKGVAPWGILVGLIVVFYSPFGLAFYVKDPPAIRKELFFFLFFYLVILGRNQNDAVINTLIALFILTSSLIHESFFFLFLPFLISYLWLNDWVSKKWLAIHFAIGAGTTVSLSKLQGNSERVLESFMEQYKTLGFSTEQFTAFAYFQKLPSSENIAEAFRHFTDVTPLIYCLVYIGHFYFLFFLLRYFGVGILFKNAKKLLLSLGSIFLMILALCLIAMDYGRWFSMGFVTSLILILTQIEHIEFTPVHRPLILTVALSLLTAGLIVEIRVPHFTSTWFDFSEWVLVFRPFVKNGIFWSIMLAGLAVLLNYVKSDPKPAS